MSRDRLNAFTDGVVAIIITIMVLELKAPHEATFEALAGLTPAFLSYVLSFVYIAIYWNNHHHLMHTVHRVDGPILWANMHLLFWMSLVPFTTAWMGENHFAGLPTTIYGVSLLGPGVAYYILQMAIVRRHGRDGALARALGADVKGKLSPLLYVVAIAASFYQPAISHAIYVLVALIWLVPDRRIEKALAEDLT